MTVTTVENDNTNANPFDADVEDVDADQALDESAPESDQAETDTVPEGATQTATTAAPAKPKRAPAPEGYITPVAWAHKLSERLQKANKLPANLEIPPQMVYSWVKQGKNPTAKDGLKSYTEGGRENLLKEDEANAWYDRKEQRVAEREAAKQAKAAEAAKQPAAAPVEAEAPTEPVAEVE
jgi:hypothetical protein